MAGNAALLIDLENFYLGRESNFNLEHVDERYDFPSDLELLCTFAESLGGGRRIIVKRAYANFNDRRPGSGERRWDYYLQPQPRYLMEQGVEPVQVFRFPGGGNKNAADMRMAMDATVLTTGDAIDLYILVTGDSDFIPLVLELKRGGAEVVVIGVAGSTKPIFQRYCDHFEFFEDLVAAREFEGEDAEELTPVREALHAMLERRCPIKFAAVKPLLGKELGRPFDPSRFDCETTGDFLREYAEDLDLLVTRGAHDWEIKLPTEESPAGTEIIDTPSNEKHSASLYRNLLRYGHPRLYVGPYEDWERISGLVLKHATTEDGEHAKVFHEDLLVDITDTCADEGMQEAGKKVNDAMFLLFKSGCFVCADEGAPPDQTDFHWSRPARLDVGLNDENDLHDRAWHFVVEVLSRRLTQRGESGLVQPEAFAELLFGPEPSESELQTSRDVIAAAPV